MVSDLFLIRLSLFGKIQNLYFPNSIKIELMKIGQNE